MTGWMMSQSMYLIQTALNLMTGMKRKMDSGKLRRLVSHVTGIFTYPVKPYIANLISQDLFCVNWYPGEMAFKKTDAKLFFLYEVLPG